MVTKAKNHKNLSRGRVLSSKQICGRLNVFLFLLNMAGTVLLIFGMILKTPWRLEHGGEQHNIMAGTQPYTRYIPGLIENQIVKNADSLGFNKQPAYTCPMWNNASSSPYYEDLHNYLAELKEYNRRLDHFSLDGDVKDLRLFLDGDNKVCQKVELHEGGLQAIFKSGQLSFTRAGWIEPLLPPMRHPEYCQQARPMLFNLAYLVHDFGAMCRKLKRTSRTVLVDMGASLDFHEPSDQPAVYLMELYRKFGIPFDHIYAYEIRPTPTEKVYRLLPSHLMPAYHWINMGVNTSNSSPLNPLNMILDNYNEDDLIVVKLDVDNFAVEIPLAGQLAADDRLGKLVDHFYFEHHVFLKEMDMWWSRSRRGSVKDSLELFSALRKNGIAAHSWV